ncbi:MAG: fatty acid desaturase [Rhodobacteraceae bacterium]|nr:fatty acid desaturase [Paracoccaceae bacterium]
MSDTPAAPNDQNPTVTQPGQQPARNWVRILAKYREPNLARSSFEFAISIVPFFILGTLAWYSLSVNLWLAFAFSFVNGGFLVRLFIIQHDCGHNSFFKDRRVNNWVGRCLGVLTLTPYKVWRRTHAIHHSSSGNLGKRGIGDVYTMTVNEFQNLSTFKKIQYRIYRHPIFLFALVPVLLFVFQNRLPVGLMKNWEYWLSAMGTNIAIGAVLVGFYWFGGIMPILLVAMPPVLVAATVGTWLFYVQHQFEDTDWKPDDEWQLHELALHGSSHYVLPPVLRWFSGNIGVHHVHHLYSRIPFYRLMEVLRDNAELANHNRMKLWESFKCARLHLWDETSHKLVSFSQARKALAT